MKQPQLFMLFKQCLSLGWLTQLDVAFGEFLSSQDENAPEAVLWAGVLASRQLGRGEVYLDLERLSSDPGLILAMPVDEAWQEPAADDDFSAFKAYSLDDWRTALIQSCLVNSGPGNTPLVLQNNRLYLRRYWQYQETVLSEIHQRLQPTGSALPQSVQHTLQALFAASSGQTDWQKIACVLALRSRFAIITGGPGSGKTTTLTKLLCLLIQLAETETTNRQLDILLAAPTGKAAARVSESIGKALQQLQVSAAIKQQIPEKAGTLHRLLGSHPNSRCYRHNRQNPLLADIVIIDEASMIDLEMMAALLEALPSHARLILLGDKDQLASVEAGSVLGDLCQGAELAAYNEETRAWIHHYTNEILSPAEHSGSLINQQTVMLRISHRFGEHSGIGQLAKAVNHGNTLQAENILYDRTRFADLEHVVLTQATDNRLKNLVLAKGSADNKPGYGEYLHLIQQLRPNHADDYSAWALAVLNAFDCFRILCALRQGDWGVAGLNQHIEQWLFPDKKSGSWYAGRPVMISRNDYNLGLMNGDIGITLPDASGKLRVVFPGHEASAQSNLRWISPMRLPELETAFAMTVHKSQGSEFQHVALILPEVRSPVLTRELVYTGITRAKTCFSLLESRIGVFKQAVEASCKNQ